MGYSNMIKAAIPELRRSTAPSVVNIASVSSCKTLAVIAQYHAFTSQIPRYDVF
jgi:NADP-dependent 3-hydroxy acid dehydrogenase YdfG